MGKTDYERIAEVFDRRYEGGAYAGIERVVLEVLGSSPGRRALEVGCGTGHWLKLLHEHGFEVIGLDASPAMLEQARARLPAATLLHGTAERLPLPDAQLDCVLCVNALHHFPDPPAFMAEAFRVLGAGGLLLNIGLDPHRGIDRWFVYDYFESTRVLDLDRFASAETLKRWLEQAGFIVDGTRLALRLDRGRPAAELLAEGIDPRWTSQLAVLPPEAFARGVDLIRQEEAEARERGEALALTAELHLWATTARKP
ncbi:methyltransferase domain-containing protein [Sorangium sp. So ce321]|uniref:class I SAM-dependent methyltransferase n=1 Tax=Sorangium sp. So ce321 TaxID=3133300 RepID=UPI003F635B5E